jgi:DNA-binding CsgD family transcriptional regulator/tetratricopeptide (TPR) repeat protein
VSSAHSSERAGRLAKASTSYDARAWTDTFEAFFAADEIAPLGPSDLERYATSAYMLGNVREMLAIQERAHRAYLADGDTLGAARAALWLATNLASRGKLPQASGWVEVSERLLQSAPEDCVERGYLLMPRMLRHVMANEFDDVVDLGGRAADIGRRFRDPDLTALAAQTQARALLRLSRTSEGLRLLDEVMISVTSSQLSPMVTGIVYCSVLEGCYETHAIKRAAVWTESLTDWCGEQPDLVAFNDQCLAHRSEILRLQGAWIEAVLEAQRAGEAGARFQIAAQALYQLGEIQRMRGDLAAAQQTYRQVSIDGADPMPGTALLRLAKGNCDAAFTSITDALAEATDPFVRIQLLPAMVEIAVACAQIPAATSAARELSEAAAATSTEAHLAWAAHAEGRVALADDRMAQAVVHLRKAKDLWQDLSMPYELARARVDLGRALTARGDGDATDLEYSAARTIFVELGATPDVTMLDNLTRRARSEWPGGLTDREAEVLRMLASGATNRSIAAGLVLSERTVDRHVSNIFTKIDVSSRSAATAWAIRNGIG